MRQIFAGILVLMCVVMLGAVAAAENQMGIADKYKVTFSQQVRVARHAVAAGELRDPARDGRLEPHYGIPATGDEKAG